MMKKTPRQWAVWFLILNAGLIATAAGIALFKSPNHFAMGGTSGLAVIMSALWPGLNVSGAMFIINAALILVGFLFLGKSFGWGTIYASVALSVYVAMFEWLVPLKAPLTDDALLEVIWAVILPGVGTALVFNIGASTGGTDIIAMILSRRTSLEVGKALLVPDFAITACTFFIFDIKTALYSLTGLLMKVFLVDIVIDGINSRKYCTIISSHPEEIKEFILTKLRRGATITRAEGAFSGKAEVMITTVLSRRQAVYLRNFIRSIDANAFITMVNSSQIIGKGFREI